MIQQIWRSVNTCRIRVTNIRVVHVEVSALSLKFLSFHNKNVGLKKKTKTKNKMRGPRTRWPPGFGAGVPRQLTEHLRASHHSFPTTELSPRQHGPPPSPGAGGLPPASPPARPVSVRSQNTLHHLVPRTQIAQWSRHHRPGLAGTTITSPKS